MINKYGDKDLDGYWECKLRIVTRYISRRNKEDNTISLQLLFTFLG